MGRVACVAGGIVGFRAHKQKRRSRDSERRSREWLGEEKLKYRLPGWAAFLASAPLFAFSQTDDRFCGFDYPNQSMFVRRQSAKTTGDKK